jgi:hypothetical protein
MQRRIMRIVGPALLLGLAAWIATSLASSSGWHEQSAVLGIGSAFDAHLQLPAQKIQATFDAATTRMKATNAWGQRLHIAGDLSGWFSFLATALITLIVGYYGRMPSQGTPNTDGLPSQAVRWIAVFAAVAAILTAGGNMALAKSQDYYTRADHIRDLLKQSRSEIIDAKSPDEAQAVLDNLDTMSGR